MRRSLLTLVVFALLAAWAGAQGPTQPLDAATQEKQFKDNRILLENLVNHGIELANADSPLARAEECRKTATTLANYLERAAHDQDPDRVVELAELMGNVVRDGLVPNLDQAKATLQLNDPNWKVVVRVTDSISRDLDKLSRIPTEGKVGNSQKVKEAISSVQALKPSIVKP